MILRQIQVGNMDNFCYIIGDSNECVIIDPGFDAEKILNEVKDFKVVKILLTHKHFDHDGEAETISKETGADILSYGKPLKDKDIIKVGKLNIKVHHTPGHSSDSVVYEVDKKLFTGDTLFVEGCGRTDLGGNPKEMQKTLAKLKEFPEDYEVYPGHDYGSKKVSTISYEKSHNSCL